jgi:F0F1-type ATP synthase assembly protein I
VPASNPPTPLDSGGDPGEQAGTPQSPISDANIPEKKTFSKKLGSSPAGMGAELAGATLVLAGLGYLIDQYLGGDSSTGLAIGGFLGFSLGMYRFIHKALQQIEKPKD